MRSPIGLMRSTKNLEVIEKWLTAHCNGDFVLELWIYGSFLQTPSLASDVDLLVKCRLGFSSEAALARRSLELAFFGRFSKPLHPIFLSKREWTEEASIIARLLTSSRRLR